MKMMTTAVDSTIRGATTTVPRTVTGAVTGAVARVSQVRCFEGGISSCIPCIGEANNEEPQDGTAEYTGILSSNTNKTQPVKYVIKYHLFAIATFVMLPCISILNFSGDSAVFRYFNDGSVIEVYKDHILTSDAVEGFSNVSCAMLQNANFTAAAHLCYENKNVSFSLNVAWWLTLILCVVLTIPICVGEKWSTDLKKVVLDYQEEKKGHMYRDVIYALVLGLNISIIVLNSQYIYEYLSSDHVVAKSGFDDNLHNLGGTMMSAASQTMFVYSWVFFGFLLAKLLLNRLNRGKDSIGAVKLDGRHVLGSKPMKGIELTSQARLITDPNMISNRVRALQK